PQRAVLVADDEETIRRLLDYNLRKQGFHPVLARDGREAIELASDDFACALVDLKMPEADGMAVLAHFRKHFPEVPVLIISAVGQVRDAVAAVKAGAFEYLTKPFDLDELVALVLSASRLGRALQENRQWRDTVAPTVPDTGFAGGSAASQKILEAVARVAKLDATVLLTGESGVGKGLLARLIHRASPRAAAPFVTVSCPALPRELLDSEMFGHERGAFTGALQRRVGRIEMATGGTLFLDEIGDLPLHLQPKLLNVLQDRQYQRLGGSQVLSADIRLVAATNVDLAERVAAREFREDLYYRLNVIPIHVPPLRERTDDLPALARGILDRIARERRTTPLELAPEALSQLQSYRWPGNVRELENTLERASAFTDGPLIQAADLGLHSPPPAGPITAAPAAVPGPGSIEPAVGGIPLDDLERFAVTQTLALCGGNKAAAARRLGITEKTIYNKMTRYGLR
ncbi:MAG: sigma-54-dependent Fis family transcriptional regulator, partial [Verrucomicrobiales bacterium]|nr:sigma-54-dependent Fis family transcriptional regulator [Verrucomicrobiales bacterium]